jgi:hypothetical protein
MIKSECATWAFESDHLITIFFFFRPPLHSTLPPHAAALIGHCLAARRPRWVAIGSGNSRPVRAASPDDGERPLEAASPSSIDAGHRRLLYAGDIEEIKRWRFHGSGSEQWRVVHGFRIWIEIFG